MSDMTEEEFFATLAEVFTDAAGDGIGPEVVLAMLAACVLGQEILRREGVELHEDQSLIVAEWAQGNIDEATMVQRCREVVSGG